MVENISSVLLFGALEVLDVLIWCLDYISFEQ
jgi:hypothetical protein